MSHKAGIRVASFGLALLLAFAPLTVYADDTFEINAILALTGSAAFLGKAQAAALGIIEDQVNKSGGLQGHQIKFVIADDQSTPQVGIQLMNGLIAKKVAAVIGSSTVAVCGAMVPLAKDGPTVYCLSPGLHPAAGSYGFSTEASTTDLLVASAVYFRQRGWDKVAIITSNDATGQDAERGIDATFNASSGVEIVDREHFTTTDVSVAAQMAHIKASGAKALIAWTTGTPVATLLRGVVDAGIDIPVETTNGNLTYAQMKAYAGIMPKDLYFPTAPALAANELPNGPVKRSVLEFINAFKQSGTRPDAGYVAAWDPALLIIDAYKKLGVNASATQMRDYLANLRGWSGINGAYDFRAIPQRGLDSTSVMIVRWDTAKDSWVGMSKPGGAPLK
jgi:branched-chain amino acid transport system substrate-binding protein